MIRLEALSRDFQVGDEVVHALKNLNLDIADGEYISIMGPSGSGKSTLLNILGLLDRPTAGRYWLNGKDVSALSDDALAFERQRNIGFVFQFFHLIRRMTALENVELPMILGGFKPAERRAQAREVLTAVGLGDRMSHRPDQLSGGQQQRVAIARAMIMKPGVLLADEPTGNLDSRSGSEVVEIVERLNQEGITLIIVTHDPEIGSRARRKLVLHDGEVAQDTGASKAA